LLTIKLNTETSRTPLKTDSATADLVKTDLALSDVFSALTEAVVDTVEFGWSSDVVEFSWSGDVLDIEGTVRFISRSSREPGLRDAQSMIERRNPDCEMRMDLPPVKETAAAERVMAESVIDRTCGAVPYPDSRRKQSLRGYAQHETTRPDCEADQPPQPTHQARLISANRIVHAQQSYGPIRHHSDSIVKDAQNVLFVFRAQSISSREILPLNRLPHAFRFWCSGSPFPPHAFGAEVSNAFVVLRVERVV
jgi:hypothetical protein